MGARFDTYLSLHVHDHDGVASIANNELFGILGEGMNAVHGDVCASEGFERGCTFGCLHAPQLHGTIGTRPERQRVSRSHARTLSEPTLSLGDRRP